VTMKKIYGLILVIVFFIAGTVTAQKAAKPDLPPEPPGDSLTLRVERIEVGPGGIILKDKQGRILRIEHPGEINLEQIDSILRATGKTKIEVEKLKKEIEAFHDSLMVEFPWEEPRQGDVVKFGQSIHVGPGEVVEGSAVAIGGSIIVDGTVRGPAVAIGGGVTVTNTGVVEEDAVAIGGYVVKHPGGRIMGENVGLGFIPIPAFSLVRGAQLTFVLLLFILSFFAGIISYSLVPKNINKIKTKLEKSFFKSLILGVFAPLLFFVAFILLLVTVIGIPVAVLVLPLILVFALVLGYTGIAYYIGERLGQNTRLKAQSPLGTILIGTIASYFLLIIWALLDFTVLWIPYLGGLHLLLLFVLGLAILYLFTTVGFGAAILSRLGTRPKDVVVQPAAPPQATTSAPAAI